jgi:hypothetical protein
MANVTDILKIQKTLRKAIKDYAIVARHDEEALISLVSVDLYLNLTAENTTSPLPRPKPNRNPVVVDPPTQSD